MNEWMNEWLNSDYRFHWRGEDGIEVCLCLLSSEEILFRMHLQYPDTLYLKDIVMEGSESSRWESQ